MEESVLSHIEIAKGLEKRGDLYQAIVAYQKAVKSIEVFIHVLTEAGDVQKRALFDDEMKFYCNKILDLEKKHNAHTQPSAPPLPWVPVNTKNTTTDSDQGLDLDAIMAELQDISWGDIEQQKKASAQGIQEPSVVHIPPPSSTSGGSKSSSSIKEKEAYSLLARAQAEDSRHQTMHNSGTTLTELQINSVINAYMAACTVFIALGESASGSARRSIVEALDRIEILRAIGYNEVLGKQGGGSGCGLSSADLAAQLPTVGGIGRGADVSAVTPLSAHATPVSLADVKASGRGFQAGNAKATAAAVNGLANLAMSNHMLSEAEVGVIRYSSVIGGRIYQPWLQGEDKRERFRYDHDYCDPDGVLPFSASQMRAKATYMRPSQLLVSAAGATGSAHTAAFKPDDGIHFAEDGNLSTKTTSVTMIAPEFPYVDYLSVAQEMVGDCSFVCSLIISALHEQRQTKPRRQLITSILYPQNSYGMPVLNPSGKYMVKLLLNGVYRKVVVDDRLPCLASGRHERVRLLCSTAIRENRLELWASIIEKAYLKVFGGYAFAGSNSGKDLYALTSWIPEQIFVHKRENVKPGNISEDDKDKSGDEESEEGPRMDHRTNSERAWNRLVSAHKFGDALITISTSNLTEEQKEATGLVSTHCYAVLDVQQAGSLQMLKIKNPWASKPWKGRFSSSDRKSWTRGLKKLLLAEGKRIDPDDENAVYNRVFDQMEKQGIFFIEFGDLLTYFKGIFVNWNPNLFTYQTELHDHWPGTLGPLDDRYYRGDNPQYSLLVDTSGIDVGRTTPVWVLFSRHTKGLNITGSSSVEDSDDAYTALHVFLQEGGHRIYDNSQQPLLRGAYCSDHHVLVRIDVAKDANAAAAAATASAETSGDSSSSGRGNDCSEYTIVLSQDGRFDESTGAARDVFYSIHVFSVKNAPFRFFRSPGPGQYKYEFTGSFTPPIADKPGTGTSGGPPGEDSYGLNPQWYVRTSEKTKYIRIHIEAFTKKEIQGNITIIELPPARVLVARVGSSAQMLQELRIEQMPPTGTIDCVQWIDPVHPPKRIRDGATSLLMRSSGPYRRGYCHLARVVLKPATDYLIVLSNYSRSQHGGYRMQCFAGQGENGSSTIKTIAELPPKL